MSLETTNIYVIWRSRLLLILRSANDQNLPLFWESPAGHVDVICPSGDNQCSRFEALRELQEETGIEATLNQIHYLPQCSTPKHTSYLLVVTSKYPPRIRLSFEHQSFMWHPIASVHIPYNTRKEVKAFLKSCSVGRASS